MPTFRRQRTARTGAYITLGATSLIPLLHAIQRYGVEDMLQYAGLKWYLLELALYGSSTCLYAVSHLAH